MRGASGKRTEGRPGRPRDGLKKLSLLQRRKRVFESFCLVLPQGVQNNIGGFSSEYRTGIFECSLVDIQVADIIHHLHALIAQIPLHLLCRPIQGRAIRRRTRREPRGFRAEGIL